MQNLDALLQDTRSRIVCEFCVVSRVVCPVVHVRLGPSSWEGVTFWNQKLDLLDGVTCVLIFKFWFLHVQH